MPQKPLDPGDEAEFRRSLERLDSLVMSSTVVALRQSGDDYATRGWCASEFFLASSRSFARGLFVDVPRMNAGREIGLERSPMTAGTTTAAAQIMDASYLQDVTAFREACDEWSSVDGPLIDIGPPGAWGEYRSLQGSTFYQADVDPNPFRRVMEAVRSLETALIERWLMSDQPRTVDLAREVIRFLEREDLRTAEPADLAYLGLVVAGHGWIGAFRSLFETGLRRYVHRMPARRSDDPDHVPTIVFRLEPLSADLRALFFEVQPPSAGTWHSRISTGSGPRGEEKEVIDRLMEGLTVTPPRFELLGS